MMSDRTPKALGFRWPAEWERHQATWLAWPHNLETWPGKFNCIPPLFARFVRCLADYEPVRLLAESGAVADAAAKNLVDVGGATNVRLLDVATDDAWVRDYGPMFLVRDHDQAKAALEWNFNAWGAKYSQFAKDNAAASQIAALARPKVAHHFQADLVLEGGAVDSNGAGELLSTSSCLLGESRNPTLTLEQAEDSLRDWMGVEKIHWLPHSQLAGDDTDGHVDQLARFTSASTIVVAVAGDDDRQHAALQDNKRFLQDSYDSAGAKFDVIDLPVPPPLHFRGQRLPASYCNFYVFNDALIVPAFGHPSADGRAVAILREQFPKREVLTLDATDLIWGLGAFHCLSQPQF